MKKALRIYHPYWDWECYKSGFYKKEPPHGIEKEQAKRMYADFLKKPVLFASAIEGVFSEWKNSCEHFLTNQNINRIAWIGQASMCYYTGVSSFYRSGYFLMTEDERSYADALAESYLKRWLNERT